MQQIYFIRFYLARKMRKVMWAGRKGVFSIEYIVLSSEKGNIKED